MRKYRVEYDIEAEADIAALVAWVSEKTSIDYSRKYINRFFDEIEVLSYLAPILPESKFKQPKRYHPETKTYVVGNKKLTVIFYIEEDYVIVDKILPSALITY